MPYDVLDFKKLSKQLTDLTFTDYYYRLMLLSRSIFEWSGLPNGINEKWIERFLYTDGCCMFFKDSEKGFMVTRVTGSGVNPYDEPTHLKPQATGFTSDAYENNVDCVLIQNNDLMIPTDPTIQLYALRLAELSRTIDINVNAQKTPFVILCTDKQKKSMKTLYNNVNSFEPVIFGDKSLDIDTVSVLKTDAPIIFDKLQLQKHAIWNECMTFLGINNANQDKKERLVDDEVQANNQQVEMSAQVMLKAREFACKQINEMFGTNISVKLRKIDPPMLDDIDSEDGSEGGEE